MSHAATNWAKRQRGLKPAAKIVLWELCDRYHPDNGCFPSQETLAYDCEISRSSLNHHLAALEAAGLILREVRRDPDTNRQERTRYRFPFEADWPGARPCPETGHGVEAETNAEPSPETGHGAVSRNDPEPCPENDESRVQNLDSNLVREPVRNQNERERRAREAEPQPSAEAVPHRALLDELIAKHPQGAHDRLEDVIKPWLALSPEERRQARDRFEAWYGARGKRQAIAGLPTYLADRMFARVAAPPRPSESPFVPAFSAAWWWFFHGFVAWASALPGRPLLDRNSAETANLAHRISLATELAIGWKASTREKRDEALKGGDALVPIAKAGAEAEAWKAHYSALGVRVPLPDKAEWIYMPARWPEAARADDRANAYAEARG